MNGFSRELSSFSDTTCDNCGDWIEEGDPFYFKDGEKWCEDCKESHGDE